MTVKTNPIVGEWTFPDDNMVTDIEGLDFQYSIDIGFFLHLILMVQVNRGLRLRYMEMNKRKL